MSTDTKTLELLSRIAKGDELAFEELTVKYRTVIDAAAASAVRSMERTGLGVTSEAREDMKQEARLALYRAAVKYDPEGGGREVTFGLYAKICVRNALISELRRMGAKKRRADRLSRSDKAIEKSTAGNNTSAVISKLHLEQMLKGSMDVLTNYEAAVLNGYIEGKKVTEISEELGKSQKSVNNALYRIRVKLKRRIQDSDTRS